MSTTGQKPSRRQQILETLAQELERTPGERITTAGLARAVGVSEAALYRHFPSKARMFEGLIEFIEESVFGLTNQILEREKGMLGRCDRLLTLLLGFAERNPGLCRLLAGDVLVGETERLQILREGELNGELPPDRPVAPLANLLLAIVEGRINQFVRSGFRRRPLELWEDQWAMLAGLLAASE